MFELNFIYYPRKIIKVKQRIIEKHSMQSQLIMLNQKEELNEIISKIKNINTKLDLYSYANKLKTKQIVLIINSLHNEKYSIYYDTFMHIISVRLSNSLFTYVYNQYQEHYDDKSLRELLLELLNRPKIHQKLSITSEQINTLNNLMNNDNNIWYFSTYILNNHIVIDNMIKMFKLNTEGKLIQDIKLKVFCECDSQYYNLTNKEELYNFFKNNNLAFQAKFISNYVQKLKIDERDHQILEYIIFKHGDNLYKQNHFFWEGLSDKAKNKIQKWLKIHRIYNALGREDIRSQFWLKYMDYMEVHDLKTKEGIALLMRFNDFGVVEFTYTGNAVYIYNKQYFDKVILQYLNKQRVRNKVLKSKENAIEKIDHRGNWISKLTILIEGIINEGVSYVEKYQRQGKYNNSRF